MIVGAFAVLQPPLLAVSLATVGSGSDFASDAVCVWREAGKGCGCRTAAAEGSASVERWTLIGVDATRALETGVVAVLIGS
jgi:hypothetical protein